MKKLLIILLTPMLLQSQTDISKMDHLSKHYLAGLGISAFAGYTTYHFTNRPFLGCIVGSLAATAAGIFKESVYDKRWHRGTCDNTSAYTTIWGGLVGSLCLRVEIDIEQKNHPHSWLFEDLAPLTIDTVGTLNDRKLREIKNQ